MTRDELPPDCPQQTRDIARWIEEFARKHGGRVLKSDVSHAAPFRPECLTPAYRHLRLTGRMRVTRLALEMP